MMPPTQPTPSTWWRRHAPPRLEVVLLLLYVVFLAIGLLADQRADGSSSIFDSPWFNRFQLLLAAVLVLSIARRGAWLRAGFGSLCWHLGLAMFLLGSWLNHALGFHGHLPLRLHQAMAEVEVPGSEILLGAPFLSIEESAARFQLPAAGTPLPVVLREEDEYGPKVSVVNFEMAGVLEEHLGIGQATDPPGIEIEIGTADQAPRRLALVAQAPDRLRVLEGMVVELLPQVANGADERFAPRLGPAGLRWRFPCEEAFREAEFRDGEEHTVDLGHGMSLSLLAYFHCARQLAGETVEDTSGSGPAAAKIELRWQDPSPGRLRETIWATPLPWQAVEASASRMEAPMPELPELQLLPDLRRSLPLLSLYLSPDGQLLSQWRDAEGRHAAELLAAADGEVRGKHGVKLRLLSYQAHAYRAFQLRPAHGEPGAEPVVHLTIERLGQQQEAWLRLGQQAALGLPEGRRLLAFQAKHRPLPFSVELAEVRHPPQHPDETATHDELKLTLTSLEGRHADIPVRLESGASFDLDGIRLRFPDAALQAWPRHPVVLIEVTSNPGKAISFLGLMFILLGVCWRFLSHQGGRADAHSPRTKAGVLQVARVLKPSPSVDSE